MDRPLELKTISITGLEKSDVRILSESISDQMQRPAVARLETNPLPGHRLGELATSILIVSATTTGMAIVGAWLLKKRKRNSLKYKVIQEFADGTKQVVYLELSASETEAPTPELIEKLASISHLAADKIAKQLESD